jgi:hypothetical protein
MFAEHRGQRVDAQGVRALDELVSGWRLNVVQPLRAVRRQLKSAGASDASIEAVRATVQAAELAAERRQLATLARALEATTTGDATTPPVLGLYAAHLGVPEPSFPELAAWLAAQR